MAPPSYLLVRLVPTGTIRSMEFWINHVMPLPLTDLMARKWSYLLDRFTLWYEDSDGDNITPATWGEFLAAMEELEDVRKDITFQVRRGGLEGLALLRDLNAEMGLLKMKFLVFGEQRGKKVGMAEDGRIIPFHQSMSPGEFYDTALKSPEEEVDDSVWEAPRTIVGSDVIIGDNVSVDGEINVVPEDD